MRHWYRTPRPKADRDGLGNPGVARIAILSDVVSLAVPSFVVLSIVVLEDQGVWRGTLRIDILEPWVRR